MQENPIIPTSMRAWQLLRHGGPDAIEFNQSTAVPSLDKCDVLIKVSACGLNNTDINTRTGWYHKSVTAATTELNDEQQAGSAWGGTTIKFPRIQGADIVGSVVKLGENANPDLLLKRVMVNPWVRNWDQLPNIPEFRYLGSEVNGGFAQYCAIDYRQIMLINSPYTDAELATFATSYVTALNMLDKVKLTADDRILITGASGGVGSALVQLAKIIGAQVIAVCAQSKDQQLKNLGADKIIIRENLSAQLAALATTNEKPSVLADLVGGEHLEDLIDLLLPGGRYVTAGAIAGPICQIDLRTIYLNDLSLYGATTAMPKIFANLVELIEQQKLKPLLAQSFTLEQLPQAQATFIAKKHCGNLCVTC